VRIRSLAGYIIGTLESRFRKRHLDRNDVLLNRHLSSRVLTGAVQVVWIGAWLAGAPSARGSGALRPIVRCRFEPDVPSGGKPCTDSPL
jgi:hypothetical protein